MGKIRKGNFTKGRMTKGKFTELCFWLSVVVLAMWCIVRIGCAAVYDNEVTGYLTNYQNAPTIETAKENLDTAIQVLEEKGLTEGRTFLSPSTDIGLWYNNLKASSEQLQEASGETLVDQAIVLEKQREAMESDTILSSSIRQPLGISVYPHNMAYILWGLLSLASCIGWFICYCYLESRNKLNHLLIERSEQKAS